VIRADLSGQRWAVYGLARSGISSLRFLQRSGASIMAWDDRPDARGAALAAVPDVQLADLMAEPLSGLAGLVVSPGVPLNRHPLAGRARYAGVPIVGDIELFQCARATLPPHRMVAITGTNGKSTTTALLHHLLESAGQQARLGGNIGLPILDQPALPAGGTYVLELSSFQIDLSQTVMADIAILTNVTPDHLDRYDGMDAYAAAKARLFAMQAPGAIAIIATDDGFTRAIAARLPASAALTSVSFADVAAEDQRRWPALPGPHNAQNIACALAAARLLGVPDASIEQGLASFPGLPHRMEQVASIAAVRFVNDSKATNPTSAAPALQAYRDVHWIVGGQAKTRELDACLPHLRHVKAAYTIGEAGELFADILRPLVPVSTSGTLQRAVRDAAAAAIAGDTVLLSPACASFDQFRDFEARGEAFRAAVQALRS